MNAFWAFVIILVIAFFLFVILPSLFVTPIHAQQRPYVHPSQLPAPAPIQNACEVEAQQSQLALNKFFKDANPDVPEDYPRKPVGACPYSKAPSTSLRMVDMPMCVVVNKDTSLRV